MKYIYISLFFILSSCSAQRVVTISQSVEKTDDKTTTISTKTVEEYHGKINTNL